MSRYSLRCTGRPTSLTAYSEATVAAAAVAATDVDDDQLTAEHYIVMSSVIIGSPESA